MQMSTISIYHAMIKFTNQIGAGCAKWGESGPNTGPIKQVYLLPENPLVDFVGDSAGRMIVIGHYRDRVSQIKIDF